MSVWQRVTSEIKTIGLVTLYFAICFGVMIFLKRLVLAAHQIEFRGLSIAIVGALIVAKVVAVMEHVTLGRRRPLRPDPRVLPDSGAVREVSMQNLCQLGVREAKLPAADSRHTSNGGGGRARSEGRIRRPFRRADDSKRRGSRLYQSQLNPPTHSRHLTEQKPRTVEIGSDNQARGAMAMKRLEGKVAVVTGGNSGIGFATARRFAAEGAHVFITGRRQNELDAAVKQIGRQATGVQGDVANLTDLDRLYAAVKQQQGRIDILFANAGGGALAPLGAITEEHFDKTFGVNVKGLLFTVQKALPLFRDGGSIILNASITASKGMEAFSVYSATKAAVRSFARCWTVDLKNRRIRVNAISPGPIDTPGYKNLG
jgi:NAD(P)-dependent dehydrogenase (short-subunit alcohol dehydrogenase family)